MPSAQLEAPSPMRVFAGRCQLVDRDRKGPAQRPQSVRVGRVAGQPNRIVRHRTDHLDACDDNTDDQGES
jgi:hypothetical protein